MSLTPFHYPFTGVFNPFDRIIDVYLKINAEVSKLNGLPVDMQNTGLAFLTILIPLAIVILTEVYRERFSKSSKIPFIELDLRVILDDVFRIKRLVLYNLMIFVPLAFWELLDGKLHFLLASISSIGLIAMIFVILNVYKWTVKDTFRFRFSYLKSREICELTSVWGSIWKCEEIEPINERGFFMILSSKIDEIILKHININELMAISQILRDFSTTFEKRSSFFRGIDFFVLPKLLEWKFHFWKLQRTYLQKQQSNGGKANNPMEFAYLYEISQGIDRVVLAISQDSVKQRSEYVLFKGLKEHVDKHKKDEIIKVGAISHSYLGDLFEGLFQFFFDSRDAIDNHQFWESVPAEWKATVSTIKQEDNLVLRILLSGFFRNFQEGLIYNKPNAGRVIPWFFPEIDGRKFAIILLFTNTPDLEVKLAIERDWKIAAYAFRAIAFTSIDKADFEAQVKLHEEIETKATYDLVYSFSDLKAMFTSERLKQYIANAKALTYPENSQEKSHQERLIEIFNEMLAYLANLT